MTAELCTAGAHLGGQLQVLAALGLAVQRAVRAVHRLLPGLACMPGTRQPAACNAWQMLPRPQVRHASPWTHLLQHWDCAV